MLVGEQDKTGKVKHYNKKWSQKIDASISWIKDAAHNSNDDQPMQVNKCIEEFLQNIGD